MRNKKSRERWTLTAFLMGFAYGIYGSFGASLSGAVSVKHQGHQKSSVKGAKEQFMILSFSSKLSVSHILFHKISFVKGEISSWSAGVSPASGFAGIVCLFSPFYQISCHWRARRPRSKRHYICLAVPRQDFFVIL